ncbi:MAG: hypothetical protein M1570_17145 [Chloroflexi bacterium]|nr:hypothetical protein [Chloroflexota bacterium]
MSRAEIRDLVFEAWRAHPGCPIQGGVVLDSNDHPIAVLHALPLPKERLRLLIRARDPAFWSDLVPYLRALLAQMQRLGFEFEGDAPLCDPAPGTEPRSDPCEPPRGRHRPRESGPSAEVLANCQGAMAKWLDGAISLPRAAQLVGVDPKTVVRWIPNVLAVIDPDKRARWIALIRAQGKSRYLGRFRED